MTGGLTYEACWDQPVQAQVHRCRRVCPGVRPYMPYSPVIRKRGFGFCPCTQRGFGFWPFRAVFSAWMDRDRTLVLPMAKTRTRKCSDSQNPNPGAADGQNTNPEMRRRPKSEPESRRWPAREPEIGLRQPLMAATHTREAPRARRPSQAPARVHDILRTRGPISARRPAQAPLRIGRRHPGRRVYPSWSRKLAPSPLPATAKFSRIVAPRSLAVARRPRSVPGAASEGDQASSGTSSRV